MTPPVWYLIVVSVVLAAVRIVCLWMRLRFAERVVQQAKDAGAVIEPVEILRVVVGGTERPVAETR